MKPNKNAKLAEGFLKGSPQYKECLMQLYREHLNRLYKAKVKAVLWQMLAEGESLAAIAALSHEAIQAKLKAKRNSKTMSTTDPTSQPNKSLFSQRAQERLQRANETRRKGLLPGGVILPPKHDLSQPTKRPYSQRDQEDLARANETAKKGLLPGGVILPPKQIKQNPANFSRPNQSEPTPPGLPHG